ncbi:GNAT family N-acetyltransferase [Roseovarius pelagicus]|uniref:GNAT family N-acetyltransferase n=1 Tax=Roseovarius pelagicus TaxID=2980108 RepID=A0ABY6DFD8_9RHOB|nr:GNAT family N-acetyltransferase [Roseovarius pelagicus]UXX84225.1 GNAT family N-acetyltransferase [Roseovarius pelagicus]
MSASQPYILRPPRVEELARVSALMLRSKAHWGYDATFMRACVAELTMTAADLMRDDCMLACDGDRMLGVAQVSCDGGIAELEALFVDPVAMGRGVGRRLFDWATGAAIAHGARSLVIVADPDAEPFYQRMGAVPAGTTPSGSIPGRHLPRLTLTLSDTGA